VLVKMHVAVYTFRRLNLWITDTHSCRVTSTTRCHLVLHCCCFISCRHRVARLHWSRLCRRCSISDKSGLDALQ